jgi:hypothetical protein
MQHDLGLIFVRYRRASLVKVIPRAHLMVVGRRQRKWSAIICTRKLKVECHHLHRKGRTNSWKWKN